MKALKSIILSVLIALLFPSMIVAETIGVFFNSSVEQIKFAAGDVKTALEAKGHTVEMLPLSSLTTTYANKKVVIALASDDAAKAILISQGGTTAPSLGEQAYALRTTTNPQSSFWALGGDDNGAMYGGLQIAENIKFKEFSETYNLVESPHILKRGVKLNLPFDEKSPTYDGGNNSTSNRNAIPNVWDMTFWTTWFDEMARNRYNVISVWNNHPFTSMIKLPEYPNVALNNVTGYADVYSTTGGALIKTMTIDQKIEFWKNVMAYAKQRGFTFYLFNWNIFLSNAKNQYGMIDGKDGVTNQATMDYMRKCMYQLLKTYPDLDGFGVTAGESMGSDATLKSLFLANTYGKGMADYAKENPQRKLNFIHRWHEADFAKVKQDFAELLACPNVTFDMSFKYSAGHMYSSTKPDFLTATKINTLKTNNLKTWFTVRNDDYYYFNWGCPDYAREYINNIPGKGDWFKGFYIGSDGFQPTRTFFSKNNITQGKLEVQRLWYMNMIWGRLAFNPTTPDEVFKNYMNFKFPEISSNDLFNAWSKASSGLPKVGELIFLSKDLDYMWYPENCIDQYGFLKIKGWTLCAPLATSSLAKISNSAANTLNGKISTFDMTDKIEKDALEALALVENTTAPANSELGVTINNIKAMSYLTIYYAYKIKGATYSLMLPDKQQDAIKALGKASCWWMKYTNLMDANFKGMECHRVADFKTWHDYDAAVYKEFTDMGGTGSPICADKGTIISLSSSDITKGTATGAGEFNPDDIIEVKAIANVGYRFLNWTENNVVVSTDFVYKFTVDKDRTLVANFTEANGCDLPWITNDITVSNTTITDQPIGKVNTVCSSNITITVDVEGLGGLDPTDYCKITYKIDGGSPQTLVDIINVTGAFAKKTYSKVVTANTIELFLSSKNTAATEIYKITNIKITPAPTAIENIDFSKSGNQGISIYPNPAENELNIEFQTEDLNREIKLFNSLGQLIFQTKAENLKNKVDVSNLKGIVNVKVLSGEKSQNLRVIVK